MTRNYSAVIAFASSKGGVGKSTTCACAASALAAHGETVHVLDLDPNKTIARWAEAFPQERLTVQAVSGDDFEAALEQGGQGANWLLIDVAGLYEQNILLAISAADFVVIPAQASQPDVFEAQRIVGDIAAFERRFGSTVPHAVLLTAVSPLSTRVFDHIAGELQRLKLPRFERVIISRTIYREMFLNGQSPHLAEPAGKAAQEIDAILGEITHRINQSRASMRRAS